MRLLCFSDVHGDVDSVKALIRDTMERRASYDAVVLAGDITNLVVDKDVEKAQRQYDEIMSLLCGEYKNVYYVPGNRDILGRGKKARSISFTYDTLLELGKVYRIGDGIKITSSPELADGDTILVQHSNVVYAGRFDRTQAIYGKAMLHIAGHTHTGVQAGSYLNTGFLYRDGSNGAEPMRGGYFDVDIDITARRIGISFHALGPVKRSNLKAAGFDGDAYAPHGRAFPIKLRLMSIRPGR